MIVFCVASVWHALIAKSISDKEGYKNAIYILEPASISVCERVSLIVGGKALIYLGAKSSGLKSGLDVMRLKRAPPVNPLKIRKLYYFCPWSPYQRVFCHMSKYAKIIRVEDGIRDYLSVSFDERKVGHLNLLAKRLMLISEYYDNDFEKYYEESGALSFIPEKFKGSRLVPESLMPYKDDVKKVLGRMPVTAEARGLMAPFVNNKLVLLIGQSLSEDGAMTIEEECGVYNRYIERVIKMGCNVVFKPHPRSSGKKKQILIAENKKHFESFLYLDSNDMVEQILNEYSFHEVVGMWSIPVIYGEFLFGVNPKSLMSQAVTYSKDSRIVKIHDSLRKELDEYYCNFV